MKILLFGKNGLLGNEIYEVFKSHEDFEINGLGHEDIDITDHETVNRTLLDAKPNMVINAAAFTYVDECEIKKDYVMTINGYANENLAKVCNSINAHLMYFSTDYVFNGEKDEGYKEDDKTDPINVYGESKLLGEKFIQKNTDNYSIIRTSWLYGMQGRNFVKTMLDLAKEKKQISVVDDQIGKPTFTKDLAEGIYDFVKTQNGSSGIFHLVNEESCSWYDFAKNIFDFANFDNVDLVSISSDQLKRPARRPRISTLHNTKLPKLRSHSEALKDYLNNLL